MAAAERLCRAQGFKATTIRQIAAEANVSTGTVMTAGEKDALLVKLKYPGVGFATAVGVVAYFVCAAYSHYRARFLGYEFWINCLGMLALSVAAALTYVV
ncbi:TetR family transcriptional regulator [Nocardia fluminea]|uniref:TetR family transcriptional regulator n=1 Tax=Nocardia fluminea TaxID=134984 RepID=UPI0034483905